MGLTVKHFTDSFKKTGVRPIQAAFCEVKGVKRRTCSACAFTALYLSKNNLTAKELIKLYDAGLFDPDDIDDIVTEWAKCEYGRNFVYGFMRGFDGALGTLEPEEVGEKLGDSVRKAIFKKKK